MNNLQSTPEFEEAPPREPTGRRQIPGFSSRTGGRNPQRKRGVNFPSVVSSGQKGAALDLEVGGRFMPSRW